MGKHFWISAAETLLESIKVRVCRYLSISECFQQQQEDGFEVLVPNMQLCFSDQPHQFTQRCFPLLYALAVIGQLLQELSHHLRLIHTAVCNTISREPVRDTQTYNLNLKQSQIVTEFLNNSSHIYIFLEKYNVYQLLFFNQTAGIYLFFSIF